MPNTKKRLPSPPRSVSVEGDDAFLRNDLPDGNFPPMEDWTDLEPDAPVFLGTNFCGATFRASATLLDLEG